ncbi:hypothetical protein B0H13DRAFT_2437998 [Mycena leptocephala]|nr:hypothetical protein B0H13DRAFT_2437998 [Mycena leptocephala]
MIGRCFIFILIFILPFLLPPGLSLITYTVHRLTCVRTDRGLDLCITWPGKPQGDSTELDRLTEDLRSVDEQSSKVPSATSLLPSRKRLNSAPANTKARRSTAPAAPRDKGLDAKAAEIHEHRDKLKEFIKEFAFWSTATATLIPSSAQSARSRSARSSPSTPRTSWMQPTYATSAGFFLVPLRPCASHFALTGIYIQPNYAPQVHHFTEWFKGRLLEIASRDVDPVVHVAMLGVLKHLGATALEEDEREQVAMCVRCRAPRAATCATLWCPNRDLSLLPRS